MVCQNVSDVHELVVVPDASDEAVLVSTNVEYGQRTAGLGSNTICVRVDLPSILQAIPLRTAGRFEPVSQRILCIWILLPEVPKRLQTDYSHIDIMSNRRPTVKQELDNLSKLPPAAREAVR